ncbi:glycosyltransferase [Nostoc sp. FACHB-133]|uniref:glycosyltransferase n=1 Tax=Nostoc sp. FACHB-133 TaxID=2692835 RepID=UPI00168574B0|nr:glycosyltransferase [Nostoc sp. FACHB-133]MBD2524364.1 glycosyltransferase [Nostoc sp. FACHB-133]
MTHFGILCPAAIGHLNPMCALGRELQRRGHRVTLFHIPDVQTKVQKAGLEFYTIGEAEFPLGSLEPMYKHLGEMSGLPALRFTISWLEKETVMLFREVPEALSKVGIEALLVDQVTSAGGTIADFVNIPFVTVCNALLTNREEAVPPYFTPWPNNQAWWSRKRNQVGNFLLNRLSLKIWDLIVNQRRRWNLPPYVKREDAAGKLAHICQLPAEFDFPRERLAKFFHYTGPLQDPSGLEPISSSTSFPFEKLNDQPLIFAALGTLQNRKEEIFETIAEACIGLDMQLVISLGQPERKESVPNLPGSPLVVAYAPQQQLISRSILTITHAGMNAVLGALSSGVPLVAIPITNEQPGIAARIAYTGAGEFVPLSGLNVHRLRDTIKRVITEDSYKKNALRLKEAIQRAGGVSRAADIIEQIVSSGKPVLSSRP